MAIIRVDVFGDSLALLSEDGSRETIRGGFLSSFGGSVLLKDASVAKPAGSDFTFKAPGSGGRLTRPAPA